MSAEWPPELDAIVRAVASLQVRFDLPDHGDPDIDRIYEMAYKLRDAHLGADERQEHMGSGLVSPGDEAAIERYMKTKDRIAKGEQP